MVLHLLNPFGNMRNGVDSNCPTMTPREPKNLLAATFLSAMLTSPLTVAKYSKGGRVCLLGSTVADRTQSGLNMVLWGEIFVASDPLPPFWDLNFMVDETIPAGTQVLWTFENKSAMATSYQNLLQDDNLPEADEYIFLDGEYKSPKPSILIDVMNKQKPVAFLAHTKWQKWHKYFERHLW